MHYLLMYDVVTDYVERRAPLRAAHIKLSSVASWCLAGRSIRPKV